MSFDINWENLVQDNTINEALREFLDDQFKSLTLPSFISGLTVSSFNLGSVPPDVSIIHISDPFDEFYDQDLTDIDERLKSLNMDYMNARNSYGYSSSEDDDDDEEKTSNANQSIDLQFPKIGGSTGAELQRQHMLPGRSSLDSLLLMLGKNHLNFLHNHNINNLGIGSLNSPNHGTTRADTPTNFLQNVKRQNTNNFIKSGKPSANKNENDIQLVVEFNYHGDMEINILVNLLVNYPSPKFITLPIKLHITDLVIHSIAVVAYLNSSVFISFLCDINEYASDYFTSPHNNRSGTPNMTSGGNFVDYITNSNTQERIDIIKKVKIESEIGGAEQNVLRNVGKVEKFLIDRLREILRDEVAWPSWICLDMNEDDSLSDEEQ